MTAAPMAVGGFFYLIGAYLMCIQYVNIDRIEMRYNPFGYREVFDRFFESEKNNDRERKLFIVLPYACSVTYFVGAFLYQVACIVELFDHSRPEVDFFLDVVPLFLGGVLFMIGGLCEAVQNRVFTRLPVKITWWSSLMNCLGGMLFLFGGWVVMSDKHLASVFYAIGSAFFTGGALLNVILWKDEQFGLSHLSAMNEIVGKTMAKAEPTILQPVVVVSSQGGEGLDCVTSPRRSFVPASRGSSFTAELELPRLPSDPDSPRTRSSRHSSGNSALSPKAIVPLGAAGASWNIGVIPVDNHPATGSTSPPGPSRPSLQNANPSSQPPPRIQLPTGVLRPVDAANGNFPILQAEQPPARFTARGVMFVWLYCAVADLAVFNFFLGLREDSTWQGALTAFTRVLPFIFLHMVLLAHSAVVQIPTMQPYRMLVMLTRWLTIVLCLTTTITFIASTLDWNYSASQHRLHFNLAEVLW